jgi:hypothetical protein
MKIKVSKKDPCLNHTWKLLDNHSSHRILTDVSGQKYKKILYNCIYCGYTKSEKQYED